VSIGHRVKSQTVAPSNLKITPVTGSKILTNHAGPCQMQHGIKGFVTPTKSFVNIGITKIFCHNKMFSSINKTFGCCSKIFGCSNKKMFFVPNFVAVTKTFFSEKF